MSAKASYEHMWPVERFRNVPEHVCAVACATGGLVDLSGMDPGEDAADIFSRYLVVEDVKGFSPDAEVTVGQFASTEGGRAILVTDRSVVYFSGGTIWSFRDVSDEKLVNVYRLKGIQ